jgi:DAK2 domain fusion protein YloV
MTAAGKITPHDLVEASARALKERKDEVNKLNVFPVPDGDTGTNMSLTMDAVVAEVRTVAEPGVGAVCHAITHGSLMGARGNSGVILSQILRGFCESLADAQETDTEAVSEALARSVRVAYQAVRKPVEGTMLTVIKDVAARAEALAEDGAPLDELLRCVVEEARRSVRHTPELLPVLKESGVVDAGGYGLAILIEGAVAALEGHEMEPFEVSVAPEALMAIEPDEDWDDDEYLYCTEFLLMGEELDRAATEEWVTSLGGSELVVGDSSTLKIHVHTDQPAEVLARATAVGEIAQVHVNNMRLQTSERTEALAADGGPRPPAKEFAFVAVASGHGLVEILESLGVDRVVGGGQTMNPSTAELLEAAESVGAQTVYILPNNKNIIMAAQQVDELTEREVVVVPTKSVPQSFAAMLAFEEAKTAEENLTAMEEASEAVTVGEVTHAVKDSTNHGVGKIKKGQVIGIASSEIEVAGEDLLDVAAELADRLIDHGGDTVTVLAGEDLSDADLEEIVGRIEAAHPSLELEAHRGEQPLYPLIMAVE